MGGAVIAGSRGLPVGRGFEARQSEDPAGPAARSRVATPRIDDLLASAQDYVRRYCEKMSGVVFEEAYVQDEFANALGMRVPDPNNHRELLSDLLLVRVGPPLEWRPLRDVFAVDGRPLRDHSARLVELFATPSSASSDQALRIARESARFNIGAVDRTLNAPGLPLMFLQSAVASRFRFSAGPAAAGQRDDVWAVNFREETRPTIFRGPGNSNNPSKGRVWIEGRTGAVTRTEHVMAGDVDATFITAFRSEPRFELWVPDEMREQYLLTTARLEGRAVYDRFREFGVSVEERRTASDR